jgi:glycosyltransferase involved in cell wall biosynthesis
MGIASQRPCYILVGPEDREHIRNADEGKAPRLDYRYLAEKIDALVVEGTSPPAILAEMRLVGVLRSFMANAAMVIKLLRQAKHGSIIFSTGETWGLPCGLALMLSGRDDISHFVYVHRVYSRNWRWILRVLRPLLKVDGWICVTTNQRRVLMQTIGDDVRIDVVSQGVDTQFFCPEKSGGNPSHKPYILSVGAEMRDYSLLFDAVRSIKVQLIVKASSRWMSDLRVQIGEIPPDVLVIDERLSYTDLRELYAGATLIVVPLVNCLQAAGITSILEAMAMGKVVVATRSAGLPDILRDRQTGLIVGPDAAELSRIIWRAMSNDPVNVHISRSASNTVRSEASIEKYAESIIAVIGQ